MTETFEPSFFSLEDLLLLGSLGIFLIMAGVFIFLSGWIFAVLSIPCIIIGPYLTTLPYVMRRYYQAKAGIRGVPLILIAAMVVTSCPPIILYISFFQDERYTPVDFIPLIVLLLFVMFLLIDLGLVASYYQYGRFKKRMMKKRNENTLISAYHELKGDRVLRVYKLGVYLGIPVPYEKMFRKDRFSLFDNIDEISFEDPWLGPPGDYVIIRFITKDGAARGLMELDSLKGDFLLEELKRLAPHAKFVDSREKNRVERKQGKATKGVE